MERRTGSVEAHGQRPREDELGDLRVRLEQVETSLRELVSTTDRLTRLVKSLRASVHEMKPVSHDVTRLRAQVDALIRGVYLRPEELDHPFRLTAQRFGAASQNGEDGVLVALFREAGIESARFVEIGCGENGGNSGFLAGELGWSGLMLDGDAGSVSACRARFLGRPVSVAQAWVTRENVDSLLQDHGLTGEIDLLSIDLDGNDYWVWEALTASSPRVVVIEFNAKFGPERSVVVPYEPDFDRRDRHRSYFGASLQALVRLGEDKGYRLVCVEPRGANAFFVRNEVAESIPACDPQEAYRPLAPADWGLRPLTARQAGKIERAVDELYEYIESHGLPLVERQ